jgi:hypothetical protein
MFKLGEKVKFHVGLPEKEYEYGVVVGPPTYAFHKISEDVRYVVCYPVELEKGFYSEGRFHFVSIMLVSADILSLRYPTQYKGESNV